MEINEAFAPVPIVVARKLAHPARSHQRQAERHRGTGGHPLGATGAILLATVLNELERRDLRRAAITLCVGFGMGVTTIIDRKRD